MLHHLAPSMAVDLDDPDVPPDLLEIGPSQVNGEHPYKVPITIVTGMALDPESSDLLSVLLITSRLKVISERARQLS